MNQADINAAKRLIAEFTGKADGRHNSAHLMGRPTELPTKSPEVQPTYIHNESLRRQLTGFAAALTSERNEAPPLSSAECMEILESRGYAVRTNFVEPDPVIREKLGDCQIGEFIRIPTEMDPVGDVLFYAVTALEFVDRIEFRKSQVSIEGMPQTLWRRVK